DLICETIYVQESGFASSEILNQIFQKSFQNALYSSKPNLSLFDALNGNIYISSSNDSNGIAESILKKIYTNSFPITKFCSFTEGIHTGADKVSKKHIKKFKVEFPVGKGIYVLSKEELSNLRLNREEREMIKPWFKNSDIKKWTANEISEQYVIYYNSNYKYKNVDNIKTFLKQFKLILINRKVRSGTGFISESDYENFVKGKKYISYIMNHSAFKRGDYYCISYPREEEVFQGMKIVVPQRSYTNKFAYNNTEWFASADVYFIKSIELNISLKYILSILNSKLYLFLLREKGKKKGEMLELYIRHFHNYL
nr:TaqI-like C-terminal specificity domain-containing protein [Ignavibacteriaceae bacterium]